MPSPDAQPTLAMIEGLVPIGQLSPRDTREVLQHAAFRRFSAGKRLPAHDDLTLFLVQGAVRLKDESEAEQVVEAGSDAARAPLAIDKAGTRSATAATEVGVLGVSTSMLELLAAPVGGERESIQVVEHDEDSVGNRLMRAIFEDYVDDRLEVPMLPDVAVRVREAMSDPHVGVAEIAGHANADPVVAARLVQVANSAAYGGVSEVRDCRDAVARLGLGTARDLITALAMSQLFKSDSSAMTARMEALWKQSTRVAALSNVLASMTAGLLPERALLAGLVNDIGALCVISEAATRPELAANPADVDGAVVELRGQVGAMVLRKWNFPDDLVMVATECGEWARDPAPAPDYCDLVMVARLLSFFGTEQFLDGPKLTDVPAFGKVAGGGLTPDTCIELLGEAEEAVDELQSTLAG